MKTRADEQRFNDIFSPLYFYKRHGSLRKELNACPVTKCIGVKTPFDAVEKWYKIKPEIIKQNPSEFKIKFYL